MLSEDKQMWTPGHCLFPQPLALPPARQLDTAPVPDMVLFLLSLGNDWPASGPDLVSLPLSLDNGHLCLNSFSLSPPQTLKCLVINISSSAWVMTCLLPPDLVSLPRSGEWLASARDLSWAPQSNNDWLSLSLPQNCLRMILLKFLNNQDVIKYCHALSKKNHPLIFSSQKLIQIWGQTITHSNMINYQQLSRKSHLPLYFTL